MYYTQIMVFWVDMVISSSCQGMGSGARRPLYVNNISAYLHSRTCLWNSSLKITPSLAKTFSRVKLTRRLEPDTGQEKELCDRTTTTNKKRTKYHHLFDNYVLHTLYKTASKCIFDNTLRCVICIDDSDVSPMFVAFLTWHRSVWATYYTTSIREQPWLRYVYFNPPRWTLVPTIWKKVVQVTEITFKKSRPNLHSA